MDHTHSESSFIATNLFILLAMSFACSVFSAACPEPVSNLLALTAVVSSIIFGFGILYCFFRLFGVRDDRMETFFQNFPISGHKIIPSKPMHAELAAVSRDWDENVGLDSKTFDVNTLFSFKYLRFLGVLLVITSLFALVFNINWSPRDKFFVCGILGLLSLASAEWSFRKNKYELSVTLSLIGYALVQFSISVFGQWLRADAALQTALPLLAGAGSFTWLMAKLGAATLYITALNRYRSPFHTPAYTVITYLTPISLEMSGLGISGEEGLAFILVSSLIILTQALRERSFGVLLLNAGLAFLLSFLFYLTPNSLLLLPYHSAWIAVIAIVLIFCMQLTAGVLAVLIDRSRSVDMQDAHLIFIHLFSLLGISVCKDLLPMVDAYLGMWFLGLASLTFVAYLTLLGYKIITRFTDIALNLAVIISALGILLQVKDMWSSVIFLGYACAVLWLSLFYASVRTRIYGFIILTISIGKLYLEFSDIFRNLMGSAAVLVIGITIIVLSYKYEAIKDLLGMGHAHHRKNK